MTPKLPFFPPQVQNVIRKKWKRFRVNRAMYKRSRRQGSRTSSYFLSQSDVTTPRRLNVFSSKAVYTNVVTLCMSTLSDALKDKLYLFFSRKSRKRDNIRALPTLLPNYKNYNDIFDWLIHYEILHASLKWL